MGSFVHCAGLLGLVWAKESATSETSEDGAVFTGSAAGASSLDPSSIMQVGMGLLAVEGMLSAVELGLFTTLGSGAFSGQQIADRLQLRSRAVYDFVERLVALGLLERAGSPTTLATATRPKRRPSSTPTAPSTSAGSLVSPQPFDVTKPLAHQGASRLETRGS